MLKRVLLTGVAITLGFHAMPARADAGKGHYERVLLISIDGFHGVDLSKWIEHAPGSALAGLAQHGVIYSNAYTSAPSDSFPGMLAQVTGGGPRSSGVFYDDSYDRALYPPGSNCAGQPGTEVQFAENIDKDKKRIDGGGVLGKPLTQIDKAQLPLRLVDGACQPVYPHEFIRTNTVFEVLRAHDKRTAWSDKHPAYEILNGRSGAGIGDLFTPEINSDIPGFPGQDNTTSFTAVRMYDDIKVQAVLHEIDGLDSSGKPAGTPALFGMNFQAVSVGQKLAKSGPLDPPGLMGGYLDAEGTPGQALLAQIQFVDDSIGRMVEELKQQSRFEGTLIIISAKHGQSPIDPKLRRAISDKPFASIPGHVFHVADDEALIWLDPQTRAANLDDAEAFLMNNKASLGVEYFLDRDGLVKYYRDPSTDSRTPDFFIVSEHGVIYTTGSKLAEHGGIARDDRHVALLVSGPDTQPDLVRRRVATAQIAPTILKAFGISPEELDAVRNEHTEPLRAE